MNEKERKESGKLFAHSGKRRGVADLVQHCISRYAPRGNAAVVRRVAGTGFTVGLFAHHHGNGHLRICQGGTWSSLGAARR